ncbi:MAG: IS630 family transposase [Bryobacteraceae bacterium]
MDEAYIEKMEDVLAVYEKPYDPAEPVVCVDEKPVSLHADVRPPVPAKPGKPAKQDNEYERRGTANVFGAVEPKAGRHFTTATPDRSGYQFACLVKRIVEHYPQAHTIHFVMDNLNIHCRKSLVTHFGEGKGGSIWDRLTVHYTPKHGSWLDQAEIELSLVSRQCLGSSGFRTWRRCSGKSKRGAARPTRNGPRSTGSSRARRPESYSGTRSHGPAAERTSHHTEPQSTFDRKPQTSAIRAQKCRSQSQTRRHRGDSCRKRPT